MTALESRSHMEIGYTTSSCAVLAMQYWFIIGYPAIAQLGALYDAISVFIVITSHYITAHDYAAVTRK